MRGSVLRGIAFGFVVAVGPVVLWACEDDSSTGGVTPTPTTPSPTTPPTTSVPGTSSGSNPTDDGGPDGASSSSGALLTEDTMKLGNFSASPINACVRRNQEPYVGPLYRAEGIPQNAFSERVKIEKVNLEVKIIAAGDTCAGTAIATLTTNYFTQTSPLHGVVYYNGPGPTVGGGYLESLATTPGKETIVHEFTGSDREPYFVRADDAGAPTPLRLKPNGDPVQLDGDQLGFLRAPGPTEINRPYKSKSGGALVLFSRGDMLLVCDDTAPTANGLTDCSPTLRAP